MRKERHKPEIANSLKSLALTYVQAICQLEETLTIVCREFELPENGCLEELFASKPEYTDTIQEIERQPVVAIEVPTGHSELQDQLHDLQVRLGRLETNVGECVDVLAGIQLLASNAEMSLTTMLHRKRSGSIRHGEMVVDRRRFTVTDGEKVCFLGDTTRFRLFEHLARWPNRYFTYSELLDSVWEGAHRSDAKAHHHPERHDPR
ncbi:MAG: hypothetical protein Tsb009_21000 [Planctomycetaceae bacterium]